MAFTPAARVPREGQVFRTPWWPIKDTALHNTVISLGNAKAAWFLPVVAKDLNKLVPYVLLPGTIVGVLNSRDSTAVPAAHRAQSPSVLVPAHAHAAGYNVVYSSSDLATDEFGGTFDLDETDGATLVAATGASTAAVVGVKPLGVVQDCVISQAYQRLYRNLKLQYDNINILSQGKLLRIPCITDEEDDIFPGDLVQVSDSAGDWDPVNNPRTSYPGRWKKFDPTGADVSMVPYIMGKCVARHRICGSTTPSTGQLLLTAIGAGNVDASTLNTAEGYHTLNRVQTVPGLALQGSGTGGVPTALTFATADASGDFWAIDIALAVQGV